MKKEFSPQHAPPPLRPLPDECCGRGCEPCIFDYYERALQRWQNGQQKG